MTRGANIAYNFAKSPYIATTENGVKYVFSSQLHLDKFHERKEEHRNKINESLSNRFNIAIDFSTLADVVLYCAIEKRGFLIINGKDVFECQKHIKFVGGNLIHRNYSEK